MRDTVEKTPAYYDEQTCDMQTFMDLIDQTTAAEDVPHAVSVEKNIPIYDVASLRSKLGDAETRRVIMGEWARVFHSGAGVVVLKNSYPDTSVLDEATKVYENIIAQEKQLAGGGADHFAAAGSNDRVWNSLQKLCEASPDVFLRYFANTAIAAVSEAWLGPNYQMTAQVNLVYPGGAAQQAHRDYHLGFQTAQTSAQYPAQVHDVSPVLTLQGGIAHCDMPIDSGPTKLLPFSQAYRPGYAAWRRDDFRAVFEDRYVQLPLAKGDTIFFSPALFHAAGANRSRDIHRFVNLLQVSSAFGRALEDIDRDKMCKLLYPPVMQAHQSRQLDAADLEAGIDAAAEGYPFPTNLDTDPPTNGLAPESQAAYFKRAIAEGITADQFSDHLDHMRRKRRA